MIGLLEELKLAFGKHPNEPDGNQVIYVENNKNFELKVYLTHHLNEIKRVFSDHGLNFIYLTCFMDSVNDLELQKAAKYHIPWFKPTDIAALRDAYAIDINELQKRLEPKVAGGAVINNKGQFFKIDVSDPALFEEQFRKIAEAYGHKNDQEPDQDEVLFRRAQQDSLVPTIVHEETVEYNTIQGKEPQTPPIPQTGSYDIDRLFRQLKEIVPEREIWKMLTERLYQDEVISRIEISRRKTIVLPDYNIEVRLRPVEMAFYILFLRHPEGIEFIRLVDYRNELMRYYHHYAVNGDPEAVRLAIDNLVNPMNDSNVNIQRSRIHHAINTAFKNQFCEAYARQYMITGERGEPKKILLPRDKVVWKIDL